MLLTTILSIDRIEMESYSLNPYHQLLYTFIDKLTYAVLVSYNCLQSSGRIILTY